LERGEEVHEDRAITNLGITEVADIRQISEVATWTESVRP
jgi:hypothetical protein